MSVDMGHEVQPDAVALKRLVRHAKHLERDFIQARVAGSPPPCPCGQGFTSFRARKEHLRACDRKSKGGAA